jgi:hypothetical protein
MIYTIYNIHTHIYIYIIICLSIYFFIHQLYNNYFYHGKLPMAPPFQLQLQVSDEGLQWLIARGLADDPLPASKEPAPSWPPEGPKAGTDGTLNMEIQRDLSNQNGDLTGFIQPKKGT